MKRFVALLLAFLAPALLAQGPQQFELVYRFTFNGHYVGEVTDRFKREGNRYQLTSSAVPKGALARLLPLLTLSSEGEIKPQGFAPNRYQQSRSNAPKKTAIAQFDWAKNLLTHQYKGNTSQTELPKGTLDALTQLYSFSLMTELPKKLEFPVSNGRKLIAYRYQKQPTVRINTPMGAYDAVEYRRIDAPGENAISVWVAPTLHQLPLRIRVHEDAGVFEQQLIRLNYQ